MATTQVGWSSLVCLGSSCASWSEFVTNGSAVVKICGRHRGIFIGRNTAGLAGDDLTDALGVALPPPAASLRTPIGPSVVKGGWVPYGW
jgi:hypothetical protein